MKSMFCFLVIISCILISPAFGENLIVNGSFEIPVVLDTYWNYEHRVGSELTGWMSNKTYRGTVQFNDKYDRVADGTQAVQIEAGGEWIKQIFPTVKGTEYTLSFYHTSYSGYGPSTSSLKVVVGSEYDEELVSDIIIGDSSKGYVMHSLYFTADSEEMMLTFQNPYPDGAWWNYPQIDNVTIYAVPPIKIDIKPGSYPNSINPKSKGKIPVAVLSSEFFYAPEEVDQSTLTFGRTGDEKSLAFCSIGGEDVNADGIDDLVCHFFTQMAEFACGDNEGILKGKTIHGTPFTVKDSVSIVPCR